MLFVFCSQITFRAVYKAKMATLVEGVPKAHFSIATSPRYIGGHYSIPWIALLNP